MELAGDAHMNATLVISTNLMPAEALAPTAATRLLAQLYRSPETGFAAWLCMRPVIWGSERAAAMVIRPAGAAPRDLLHVLEEHVDMLHSEVAAGGQLTLWARWKHRERMEILLVDMMDIARSSLGVSSKAGQPAAAARGPGSARQETLDVPEPLRFSRTEEGAAKGNVARLREQ